VDSFRDAWAHMENLQIPLARGESLQVQVSDLAGRIDLNAVIAKDQTGAEKLAQPVFDQLVTLIDNALRGMGEHEKSSDESLSPEEIAYAIADWVDGDEIRIADGGFEDQYYNSLEDPYSSKNGPFDSVAEVQLVAGIDDRLYAAIKDALTVYPFTGGGAINPNTAPPVVLGSLRVRENAAIESHEPLTGEQIAAIVTARRDGNVLRSDQELKELLDLDPAAVFSPALVYGSSYFAVDATAVVNGTVSRLHAVVDRGGEKPKVLYWRVD
jgi:type II secretory pathway component PulK